MYKNFTLPTMLGLLLLTAAAASANERPRPFTVGVILPLTGSVADYGMAIQNSIELARKDHPDLFKNIKLIYEDVQYDNKLAVAAFQRFRTVTKVDLVYTFGVTFCKALAPLAESAKLPLVGQCIDPTTGAGRAYVLRFMNYTDEYLRAQTAYLARRGLTKIGVLLSDNSYLEEMFAALERSLLPGQTIEIIERLPAGTMDIRSAIVKAKTRSYDVIGVFLATGQIPQYFRQARELAFNLPSFGTNWFESLTEVDAAGGAMDGTVFASNLVYPDYIKRYRAAYGNESQLAFGAPAYEFAATLGELFGRRTEKISSAGIMKAFGAVAGRPGTAAGPYVFAEDPKVGKYFRFPIVVKQVAGKEFRVIE